MTKFRKITSIIICVLMLFITTACNLFPESNNNNGGGENMNKVDANQNYIRTSTYKTPLGSCHDPAIIKEGNTYYLFGTNSTTRFSSTDLITWSGLGEVFSYRSEYYSTGTYKEQYDGSRCVSCAKEMVDHVMAYYGNAPQFNQTSGYWAPDIIKYNGEYRLYFCMSLFGKAQSAIGFATATNINGPFTYKGIVIKSSGHGSVASYPNAIDPAITIDKDGRMWMSYGSFFGGIYIIELDPATGFIKSGNGHVKNVWVTDNPGTKICAGSVEGPYIIYNAETDYYYLFVSYGDLNRNYNMRVGRSKNITGPYTYSKDDSLQMQTVGGNENNHGNKLLGGYYFGFNDSVSRMAPGHCSLLNDNGEYFVVNHVRNTGNSNFHYIQVHKLLFNEKGWPVMMPNTYAGEKVQNIGTSDLTGNWKVILNLKTDFIGQNNTINASDVTIGSDKKISGVFEGTVQMYEGGKVRINLTSNLLGDDEEALLGTYYGYVVSGYDYDNGVSTLYFSAMNDYGFTIIGEKAF